MRAQELPVVTPVPRTEPARFCSPHPRRNLPKDSSQKRAESNFVGAFYRQFEQLRQARGQGGKEFSLPNFGIADLVWVCTPLTGEVHITAFEMKLSEWRKALSQAYRYRYFADRAIVVLPPAKAKLAREVLPLFRDLEVGLWSFDKETGAISELFTPRRAKPKSAAARERALSLLSRKLDFRQVGE